MTPAKSSTLCLCKITSHSPTATTLYRFSATCITNTTRRAGREHKAGDFRRVTHAWQGRARALVAPMSVALMRRACFTTSWWKNGAASARSCRSTSATSRLLTYSCSMTLMRARASSSVSVASAHTPPLYSTPSTENHPDRQATTIRRVSTISAVISVYNTPQLDGENDVLLGIVYSEMAM